MRRPVVIIISILCIVNSGIAKEILMPRDSVEKMIFSSGKDLNGLNELLVQFRSSGDSVATALTLYAIGRIQNHNSDYIKSVESYKQAAAIQSALGETSDEIQTMIGIATSCRRMGAYSSASDFLFHALNLLENSDFVDTEDGKKQHSYILNGIGNVYKYLDNKEEAEKYFRKSLAYDMQTGNYVGMAMNWNTIGSIYEHRSQFDSAAVMYNRALMYNKYVKMPNGTGICHNKLGQLAYNTGDLDKAEKEFQMAYDVLKSAKDKWNLTKSSVSLAVINIEKGNLGKAKAYLKESEELVKGRLAHSYQNDIHYYLSKLYEKEGNYRKAYEEAMISMEYADSMSIQRDEQAIAQSRIKFEQEQYNVAMNKVLLEKNKQVVEKKAIMIASLLIGLVLIIILLIMYRYGRLQEKHNQELTESNAIKNKFFSIISHDLKNPVIAQKNTLQLLVNNYERLPQDIVFAQCKELSKSSESLLELLMSLLNWSRIEVGKMKFEPVRLDLATLTSDAIKPLNEQMTLKGISTTISIPQNTFAFSDINTTKTVVRNLVSNAIKFSNLGGNIEISILPEGDFYKVNVIDHGIGMDSSKTENLFDLGTQKYTIGTAGETGSGLGLIVCKELVEMGGGKISVKSAPQKGTTISFTIKKTT